jgi:hypothetical protein
MTHAWCRTLSPAALAASLVVLSLSKSAAADAVPAPANATPDAAAAAAAPAPAEPAPYVATPATTPILGPVEHLGADAYPNQPVRGIAGGSLWATFHGLQWPYMPHSGVGVGGYVWLDNGYEAINQGGNLAQNTNPKLYVQQGRFLLRITPTWTDGKWFVQGQSEFVADRDQEEPAPLVASVDDMWVKFGRWKTFDLQVGRYEAWEVYHFGMGLDLYTLEREGAQDAYRNTVGVGPVPIYGVTNLFYRQGAVGQAALHLYPTSWLRFEIGSVYGNDPTASGNNEVGARPVAIADFGWVRLKLGAEWDKSSPSVSNLRGATYDYGAGGSLQFVFDPYIEFGANYAYGGQIQYSGSDGTRTDTASFTEYSVGGFANARIVNDLILGVGLNYTYNVDQDYDPAVERNGDFSQWQGFAAIQYKLFSRLFIKLVGGYALAILNPNTHEGYTPHKDDMESGRLRLQYLF